MFFIFANVCKKYSFNFVLSTCGELKLSLHPNNTFDVINIQHGYYNRNFNKLFLKAIKEMRAYRKGCVY